MIVPVGAKRLKKFAVIGAGWAGLSAAIELTRRGAQVSIFEAAPQAGGRARTVHWKSLGQTLQIDNGQHILIGAYRNSLRLMRDVGVDVESGLQRLPFGLPLPHGWKMRAPRWPAPLHLLAAFMRSGYAPAERRQLLKLGLRVLRGVPAPGPTVAQWLGDLRGPVWDELIDPLCVAALNTPTEDACAWRFAFALRQTLLARASAADFLVPRASLSELFADGALRWLRAANVTIKLGSPVRGMIALDDRVSLADERFDGAIIATSPHAAGDLLNQVALQTRLAALNYEPIATCYLRLDAAAPIPFKPHAPMIALPAQNSGAAGHWLFARELSASDGNTVPVLAVVTSAARAALTTSRDEWLDAVTAQLQAIWPDLPAVTDRTLIVEKRATFSCVPHAAGIGNQTDHPRVWLAGDYTEPNLPATLEAAVISGKRAAVLAMQSS